MKFTSTQPSFAISFVKEVQIEDETSYIFNTGFFPTTTTFQRMTVDRKVIKSSWGDYPERYKFMSIQINIKD